MTDGREQKAFFVVLADDVYEISMALCCRRASEANVNIKFQSNEQNGADSLLRQDAYAPKTCRRLAYRFYDFKTLVIFTLVNCSQSILV